MLSKYQYFGSIIESSISLPELAQADLDTADLFFSLRKPAKQVAWQIWLHQWYSPNGETLLSYGQDGLYHWLRFPDLADFRLSTNVKEVACYPVSNVPDETIRHLLLDQVLPRCLAHQGKIMLHASAVRVEQGLLLFIGDSGAGKSTLAGNFHRAGNLAVSDDCLWVKEDEEQVVAVPGYGGLRLWGDSLDALFSGRGATGSVAHYSVKRRVYLDDKLGIDSSSIPVLAVIMLSQPSQASSSAISLERLSHREAFIAILKQTFQLDLKDHKRMTRHARALGRMVPRLPSFRLSMPHDYNFLPQVRQTILDAVADIEHSFILRPPS